MNNLFLTPINEQQSETLQLVCNCSSMTVGTECGIIIEEADLEQVLTVLNAREVARTGCDFEGIQRVVLAFRRSLNGSDWSVETDWEVFGEDPFATAARQILTPLLQCDIVLHRQRGYVQPNPDGKFHIHIGSSAEPNGLTQSPPSHVFGAPVDGNGLSFSGTPLAPSGLGISIVDEYTQYVAAELIGKNLYIFDDLLYFGGSVKEEMIFRLVLHRLVAHLDVPAERRQKHYRNMFIEECSKSSARSMAAVDPQQELALRERLRDLKKSLSKTTRSAHVDEERILRDNQVAAGALALEYDGLLQIPKVKDVTIDGNNIVVYTDVLYCRDDRTGYIHEIGAFKIELPITNGFSPRWFNETRKVDAFQGSQQAPHIWADGSACLGNTAALFSDLFSRRQFALAAQLAIEFVESANTSDSAGKRVNQWPIARYS